MWFLLQLIDHNIHESNEVTAVACHQNKHICCYVLLFLFNDMILLLFSALVPINYDNIQLLCGDKLFLDVC